MTTIRKLVCAALATMLAAAAAPAPEAIAAGKGHHCEIKKNGKTKDDKSIKSRKECKKKGGKWVKDHDHDHDHSDGADHEHEEED